MTNNILRKATGITTDDKNIYESYNLKENPFPVSPFINQEIEDKRYNGDIYEASIRNIEESKIEDNFLKIPQTDPNHIRVGYIHDTSYVGRGNGKSSFALNLIKKINKSFCLDISGGVNKCFGLYVCPEPSGKTKTFSNFLDIWAEAIFNSNIKIIDYALAALRLDAILNLFSDKITEEELADEKGIVENMNSLEWFNTRKIPYDEISSYLTKNNEFFNKITATTPFRKRYTSYNNLSHKIISTENIREYYKELKKENEKINFIFNDLVYLFLAAGFNGAYIIVDDFERIPDFQSDRLKRDFAFELRTNFFDGVSANSKLGFYNLLLMLHAGVPRLVEKAWSDSGMEQRSSISSSTNAPHIVHFNKLDKQRAISLIKKYLSEFRITNEDSISPFTEEAIAKIGEEKEYNAAQMLSLACMLLENCAKEGKKEIGVAEVNHMLQKSKIEVKTVDNILDENSTDLLSKATE
ncbi:hypothetical protein [Dysgonomonas sp. GY617]|uniref:hypothetical protein n=1 Tax=Dysgonomonas sp. GY617 TaxID=2780420 RepID=UPI001883E70F|nr:hypothetical protein [Dysgonomonas sp. GY617]MBF0578115.1 hypothetical protein [Dysgonomonas sp. GY617]